MARYIDADALIYRICEERDGVKIEHACDIGYHNGLNMAASMAINAPTIESRPVVRVEARPLEEWHEDYGDVLWWKFPIEEPPYVGSPLDCNWSGYHTHWTPIEVPEPPNCGADMRGDGDEAVSEA